MYSGVLIGLTVRGLRLALALQWLCAALVAPRACLPWLMGTLLLSSLLLRGLVIPWRWRPKAWAEPGRILGGPPVEVAVLRQEIAARNENPAFAPSIARG